MTGRHSMFDQFTVAGAHTEQQARDHARRLAVEAAERRAVLDRFEPELVTLGLEALIEMLERGVVRGVGPVPPARREVLFALRDRWSARAVLERLDREGGLR